MVGRALPSGQYLFVAAAVLWVNFELANSLMANADWSYLRV